MDEATFQAGLIEAKKNIQSLPEDQQMLLLELLQETRTRQAAIQSNSHDAHMALEDLRLSLAYLAFDYEATEREHAQWRREKKKDGE